MLRTRNRVFSLVYHLELFDLVSLSRPLYASFPIAEINVAVVVSVCILALHLQALHAAGNCNRSLFAVPRHQPEVRRQ